MQNLEVGDMAVYPAQGVAEVVDIETKELMGRKMDFYVLRVLDTDMKIMVPRDKADDVGLREVIDPEEVEDVYDVLRERDVRFDRQTWNRRYRGFMEKLKTGSIYDVAEVFRDLYLLKNTKVLSFGERRMLETARNLLVKEMSVAKQTTEDEVQTELESLFQA